MFFVWIGIVNEGCISVYWRMKFVFEESYLDLEFVCIIFEEILNIVFCGGGVVILDFFFFVICEKVGLEIFS